MRLLFTALVALASACGGAQRPAHVSGIQLVRAGSAPITNDVSVAVPRGAVASDLFHELMLQARSQGAVGISALELHLRFEKDGEVYDCVSLIGPAAEVGARFVDVRVQPGAFVPRPTKRRTLRYRRVCQQRRVAVQKTRNSAPRRDSIGRPVPARRQTYTVYKTRQVCRSRPESVLVVRYPHHEQNRWKGPSWRSIVAPYAAMPVSPRAAQVCIPSTPEVRSILRAHMHVSLEAAPR